MVRYLQLAHNVWDPVAKRSTAHVIYNFGREDVTFHTDRCITVAANALLPTLMLVMMNLGFVRSGAVLVETVFNWLGLACRKLHDGARLSGHAGSLLARCARSHSLQPNRRHCLLLS